MTPRPTPTRAPTPLPTPAVSPTPTTTHGLSPRHFRRRAQQPHRRRHRIPLPTQPGPHRADWAGHCRGRAGRRGTDGHRDAVTKLRIGSPPTLKGLELLPGFVLGRLLCRCYESRAESHRRMGRYVSTGDAMSTPPQSLRDRVHDDQADGHRHQGRDTNQRRTPLPAPPRPRDRNRASTRQWRNQVCAESELCALGVGGDRAHK